MPFGYLEFSRAIGRELCPHMHARAAAGCGGGSRPAGTGAGPGPGSLPGLVLFESDLTGMGCEHTRSTPDPNRPPTAV